MDMNNYKVYRGTKEIGTIYKGTKEINYNVSSGGTPLNLIKTLWVNTIDIYNIDLSVRNLKVYRADGTLLTENDYEVFYEFKKANNSSPYVRTPKPLSSIITPTTGNGINLYIGIEVGAMVIFKSEETISKIEIDLKNYSGNKDVKVEVSKVNSDIPVTGNGDTDTPDYEVLYTDSKFALSSTWTEKSTVIVEL